MLKNFIFQISHMLQHSSLHHRQWRGLQSGLWSLLVLSALSFIPYAYAAPKDTGDSIQHRLADLEGQVSILGRQNESLKTAVSTQAKEIENKDKLIRALTAQLKSNATNTVELPLPMGLTTEGSSSNEAAPAGGRRLVSDIELIAPTHKKHTANPSPVGIGGSIPTFMDPNFNKFAKSQAQADRDYRPNLVAHVAGEPQVGQLNQQAELQLVAALEQMQQLRELLRLQQEANQQKDVELATVRHQASHWENLATTHEQSNRVLTDKVAVLEEDKRNLEQNNAVLTQAKALIEGERDNLVIEKSNLTREKTALEQVNQTLTNDKAILATAKSTLELTNTNLNNQLHDATSEKDTLTLEKQNLTTRVTALEGENNTLTTDKTTLTNQVAALTADKVNLETEKDNFVKANKVLEEDKTKLLADNSKIAKLEVDNAALATERDELKKQNRKLDADLTDVNDELETLKDEKKEWEKMLKGAQDRSENLAKDNDALKTTNNALTTKKNDLFGEKENLAKQLAALEQEKTKLVDQLKTKTTEAARSKEEEEKASKLYTTLNEELTQVKQKLSELQYAEKEWQTKLRAAESARETADKENQDLNKANTALKKESEDLAKVNEDLTKKNQALAGIQKEKEDLASANTDLLNQKNKFVRENDELQRKLADLTQQHQTLTEAHKALQTRNKKLEGEKESVAKNAATMTQMNQEFTLELEELTKKLKNKEAEFDKLKAEYTALQRTRNQPKDDPFGSPSTSLNRRASFSGKFDPSTPPISPMTTNTQRSSIKTGNTSSTDSSTSSGNKTPTPGSTLEDSKRLSIRVKESADDGALLKLRRSVTGEELIIKELEDRLAAAQYDLAEYKQLKEKEIETLKEGALSFGTQIKQYIEETSDLKTKLVNAGRAIELERKATKSAREAKAKLQHDYDNLRAEIEEKSEKTQNNSKSASKNFEKLYQDELKKNKELQDKVDELNKDVEKYKDQIEKKKRGSISKNKKMNDNEETVGFFVGENEILKKELETTRQELSGATNENDTLQTINRELMQKVTILSKANESLNSEAETKIAKLTESYQDAEDDLKKDLTLMTKICAELVAKIGNHGTAKDAPLNEGSQTPVTLKNVEALITNVEAKLTAKSRMDKGRNEAKENLNDKGASEEKQASSVSASIKTEDSEATEEKKDPAAVKVNRIFRPMPMGRGRTPGGVGKAKEELKNKTQQGAGSVPAKLKEEDEKKT